MGDTGYSADEIMTVTAARALRDRMTCFVGIGLPTDLGMLEPDAVTCELMLTAVYPGVGVADVRERTGWDLLVSGDLREIPPPSAAELTTLRGLLATMPAS